MRLTKKVVISRAQVVLGALLGLFVCLIFSATLGVQKYRESQQSRSTVLEQQKDIFLSALDHATLKISIDALELQNRLANGDDVHDILAQYNNDFFGDNIIYIDTNTKTAIDALNAYDKSSYNFFYLIAREGESLKGPFQIPFAKDSASFFSICAPVYTGSAITGYLMGILYPQSIISSIFPLYKGHESSFDADNDNVLDIYAQDDISFFITDDTSCIIASDAHLLENGFTPGTYVSKLLTKERLVFKSNVKKVYDSIRSNKNASFLYWSPSTNPLLVSHIKLPVYDWHLFSITSARALLNRIIFTAMVVFVFCGLLVACFLAYLTVRSRQFVAREKESAIRYEQERILREICYDLYDNVFELDVSKNLLLGKSAEAVPRYLELALNASYDACLKNLLERHMKDEFKKEMYDTLCTKNLLRLYSQGIRIHEYYFMDNVHNDDYVWKKAKVRLFNFTSTGTIRALIFVRNVDAEKKKELSLIEKSEKDFLTNLLNKYTFDAQTKLFLERSARTQCHALIIFDIDNFRQINETFGYFSGDNIIMTFIETIKAHLHNDDLMGRIGGVCFAVLLKNCEGEKALKQLLQDLVNALHREITENNITCTVSASIGAALFPDHAANYKDLFDKANDALYFSQTHGMDTFTIYNSTLLEHKSFFVDEKDIDELVNTAADGIAKIAVNPEFTLLYTNQKLLNLLGRTAKDVEADGFMGINYFHPEDVPNIFETLYFALEKKTPYSVSYRIQHKNGQYISVRTKCIFVDERYEGKYPVLYSIFTDVTDMVKITEELVEAKETAQAATKAKSNFLASMSHEIRTPMNAIMGMSDLILMDKTISPAILEYARNIGTACRSLLGIINDILDISKIESGKLTLVNVDYSFETLIQNVVSMIKLRAEDKYLDFFVHINPHLPARFLGDEIRIKQVLLNLLSNAVKYTKEGSVTLSVNGQQKDDGFYLQFVVNDTGMGIKDEDYSKLFSEFERLDTQKNRNIVGTGLGLAISKQLCEMMGGSIVVKSVYGEGSTFTATVRQDVPGKDAITDFANACDKRVLYFEPRGRFSMHMMVEFDALNTDVTLCIDMASLMQALELTKVDENGKAQKEYDFIFVAEKYYDKVKNCLRAVEISGIKIIVLANSLASFSDEKDICALLTPVSTIQLAKALAGDFKAAQAHFDDANNFTRVIAPSANVLVVDDNGVNLKVASGLLNTHEIIADTALSGFEALEKIRRNDYDLIFMDHFMPEMDGIETTKKLRSSDSSNKDKPVIALTANALAGVREMFLQEGLNDFLSKPIEPARLNEVLEKWLPAEKISYAQNDDTADAQKSFKPIEADGFSFESGLSYAGGDIETYKEILTTYVNGADEREATLRNMLETNSIKDFTTNIHGLKSSSLYVGAELVSKLAAQLEKAGLANDVETIKKDLEPCLTQYAEIVKIIREFLEDASSEIEDEPKLAGDKSFLQEKTLAVKTGAKNLDIINIENIMKEIDAFAWGEEVEVTLQKLRDAVFAFDYDGIAQIAEELLATLA